MTLVLDTGPLLAALDAADPDHDSCSSLLLNSEEDLAVPVLVMAELDYWCARRLPPNAWAAFLADVHDGVYRVEPLTRGDLARCRQLQADYEDLGIGIVDSSIVALVERLGEPKVATLDRRHFSVVKTRHVEALSLLPE
ncbi:MAG: type II toxin-antitoxin system VapC family toxin [Acidimicrobiales bacterium]